MYEMDQFLQIQTNVHPIPPMTVTSTPTALTPRVDTTVPAMTDGSGTGHIVLVRHDCKHFCIKIAHFFILC